MEEQNTKTTSKEGIGGWLILVLIALIVTPLRLSFTLIKDFIPLFKSMPSLAAFPELQTMIYVETFGNIIFIVFSIVLLIVMVNKDRRFPLLVIIFYVSNLIFVVGDAIIASQIEVLSSFVNTGDSMKEIARSFVGTVIWVPYMLLSSRVKNTFVK